MRMLSALLVCCIGCGPVMGQLPTTLRNDVEITAQNSSDNNDGHFSSTVLKVKNHSGKTVEKYIHCSFSTPDGRNETAYQWIKVESLTWHQVYLSAPLVSRFRVKVRCQLLEEIEL